MTTEKPYLDAVEPDEPHHRFPCSSCGADFRFAPGAGKLVCDHCGAEEPLSDTGSFSPQAHETDIDKGLDGDLPQDFIEETRVLACPNCGANVEFNSEHHAAECPFCATAVVTGTGVHRHIKPAAVLPFGLEERAARQAMADWLGRLWFAPNGLQEYARKGRKLTGIYVPYWTFDADTKSRYSGERGTVYYETRTVRRDGKTVQQRVQKVRWRRVTGRVARWFDDVLVLASKSLPKDYTDSLEPWDLSDLEAYAPEYLAGFRAEGYTISLEDGFDEAKSKMDAVIRRDIRFDIGGDRQRIHSVNTSMRDVTFKHILLPVWIAAYKYRGKTYRFVVNGQSGKVKGERPWSAIKIALAVLVVAIAAAAIGYAIAINEAGGFQ